MGGRGIRNRLLASVWVLALLVSACAPRTGAPPAAGGSAAGATDPDEVADFYRGKTLTIIVGSSLGGATDTTARVLARHIGTHIPGSPDVIVENMAGAGSQLAANHLYNVAEPDGLTIGTFEAGQIVNQATGGEGIQFDARNFGWLGTVQRVSTVCTIRADSPYNTPQDLMRQDLSPLILGGSEPGAATVDFPKLMNGTLGTNLQLVSGYAGTGPIRLAMESGEVDGMCWSWDSFVAAAQNWLETNYVKVLVYSASERDPRIEERFPGAARAEDLTTDPQVRQLIRAGAAGEAISRPFVAPPGVPPERLRALQEAFAATMQDPAFLADMQQARLEVTARSGDEALEIVNEILDLPPDLSRRLADIRK